MYQNERLGRTCGAHSAAQSRCFCSLDMQICGVLDAVVVVTVKAVHKWNFLFSRLLVDMPNSPQLLLVWMRASLMKRSEYFAMVVWKFKFLFSVGYFQKYHDTLCLSPKILRKHWFLFPLGTINISPRRKWKHCLCKILEEKLRVLW